MAIILTEAVESHVGKTTTKGFPEGSAGKESACNVKTWVGKIPWRRERLFTPAFWPGEFHGLYSPWGGKQSDTTKRLSLSPVA